MSDRFVISGFGGKKTLSGVISVSGAKNAALKAIAAVILFKDQVTLTNIPDIEDVKRMGDIFEALGGIVTYARGGKYVLSLPPHVCVHTVVPHEIGKRIRASIVFTGPLLSRFGRVSFPHPGGCVIGARPIDLFLSGFEKMGARIVVKERFYEIVAPGKRLRGATIIFPKPSVTATETLMMAAVLARGKTRIQNAAQEPEIVSLAEFLNMCGAHVKGAGTATIDVVGVNRLLKAGRNVYDIPPDRIETGSFLLLGALAGNELEIKNCNPSHAEMVIELLRSAGLSIEVGKNMLFVRNNAHPSDLSSVDIQTKEYPGFPTDLQAPMVVFLTQTKGSARVFETIFEGRLSYVSDLVRMGARIDVCDPHRVIVHGPTQLTGRELESPDLRAGLAFVIAALIAKGRSVVHNVYNIDRGYEKIEERLQNIGARIKRVS